MSWTLVNTLGNFLVFLGLVAVVAFILGTAGVLDPLLVAKVLVVVAFAVIITIVILTRIWRTK